MLTFKSREFSNQTTKISEKHSQLCGAPSQLNRTKYEKMMINKIMCKGHNGKIPKHSGASSLPIRDNKPKICSSTVKPTIGAPQPTLPCALPRIYPIRTSWPLHGRDLIELRDSELLKNKIHRWRHG